VRFDARDPSVDTFYAELAPTTDQWIPATLEVSGLDREALRRGGRDPREAMDEAAAWVREQAGDCRPVLVGFPLVFDWMFVYSYFVRFAKNGSPFDFSSGLDMKTMYQQKAGVVLSKAGKDDLPPSLRGSAPHSHHALGDAIEQGQIFTRLFEWKGP
jgi:hypothetical protein